MNRTSIVAKTAGLFSACAVSALAGTVALEPATIATTTTAFENTRRPITNPTLFDNALPQSNVHPIFMYHRLPDFADTTLGPLAMGGHVEIYALQLEWALTDRLSLVATKDGYVRFRPDTPGLWSAQEGFANLAGGLKYAFILDPVNEFVLSGSATFEFPTGNQDVFQGEGDGAVNLIVSGLKMWDRWQFAGGAGIRLPFDGQMSTNTFVSTHVSYEVVPWFIPLVELNWHHVLEAGNGRASFFSQAGGAVPVVATFEGNDLLNFGAANASQNRDLVTAAVGFRSRITESVDLGFAYEFPLTDEETGIIEDRFTADLVWRF
ncbi:hypothetical protein [Haloferula rosea]|uniref:Transporter n=1 Tax=Haloferula rosea TaxID=490093 RepID=A0A934RHN3_9BACT|nr:hypothetical protein [Haloferula rosea]MBK1828495.1 hypothetical protein [Haloferula rosea]